MNKKPPKDAPGRLGKLASPRESRDALDFAPAPAADEAVKEALNIAESVGAIGSESGEGRGEEHRDADDALSLNDIIDQVERRSRFLFSGVSTAANEPLEELDALDIAAQFGRPSEDPSGVMAELEAYPPVGFEDTKDLSPSHAASRASSKKAERDHSTRSVSVSPPSPGAAPEGAAEAPATVGEASTGPLPPTDVLRVQAHESAHENEGVGSRVAAISGPGGDVNGTTSGFAEMPREERASGMDVDGLRTLVDRKMATIREGTYFEILEISPTATDREISAAMDEMMRRFADERFQASSLSDMKMDARRIRTVVEEAYEVLKRPQLRESYRRACVDGGA